MRKVLGTGEMSVQEFVGLWQIDVWGETPEVVLADVSSA